MYRNRTLTEAQVQVIKKLYGLGSTIKQLSQQFIVHRSTIQRLLSGVNYKDFSSYNQYIENKTLYEANPKQCLKCDLPISFKKRINNYCSRSCAASENNKHKLKKAKPVCIVCGHLCNFHRVNFCSNKCAKQQVHILYIQNWKAGLNTGGTEGHLSVHIRKYIFEKYNNQCCKCDWHEVNPKTGKVPVQVNHIDGNANNNKEENLELLCPNCHALTPNLGGANVGHGRKYRRDRYRKVSDSAPIV